MFFDQSVQRALVRWRLPFAFLLLALVARPAAGAEAKTENYPDGAKHLIYAVNGKGLKNGSFKEFHPNGKPKTQAVYRHGKLHGMLKAYDEDGKLLLQETYRDGKLHGQRQEFAGKRVVKDEFWLDGELLVPRSAALLISELKAIQSIPIKTVGEPPKVYDKIAAALRNPGQQAQREAALRVLMAYRCLCGLPYRDMVLDWTYIAHTEAACDVLTIRNKGLSHNPENPGMPDEDFRLGAKGCGNSNLHFGSNGAGTPNMTAAVHGFMDDSDASNIDRVGHRRWCLNPTMLKTGFGSMNGNYCAMWSLDSSRTDVPDYNFVAFPPRGLTPASVFHDHVAWSVSLNPAKYQKPDPERVKVQVQPVVFQPHRSLLQKSEQPLPLNYTHVSLDGFGIPYCIIFRPANFHTIAGSSYWVEISGLNKTGGEETQIGYLVSFMSL